MNLATKLEAGSLKLGKYSPQDPYGDEYRASKGRASLRASIPIKGFETGLSLRKLVTKLEAGSLRLEKYSS